MGIPLSHFLSKYWGINLLFALNRQETQEEEKIDALDTLPLSLGRHVPLPLLNLHLLLGRFAVLLFRQIPRDIFP